MDKSRIPQAMMTVGQLFIIPSIWFIFTADHTVVGVLSSIIACYLFACVGVTISVHMYFTHRSFKLSENKERILSLFAVLSTWISPVEWTTSHWHHHKYSDTELDSHSPKHLGWKNWLFIFHRSYASKLSLVSTRMLKKKWHLFLINYKYVIVFSYALIVYGLGGIDYLFYLWIIPTTHAFWSQIITVNNHIGGEPRNSVWQNWITLGEGYHKHHHEYPKNYDKGFFVKQIVNFIKEVH
jgi:stearoyl-CoA desaturase (delta-9 desaturase)